VLLTSRNRFLEKGKTMAINKKSSKSTGDETIKKSGRRQRAAVPGSYDDYDNETHGSGYGGGVPPSDHCINTAHHQVQMVLLNKDAPTFIRPFPCINPADQDDLLPGRKSSNQNGQHPWLIRVPVAKMIGTQPDNRATFILHKPGDNAARNADPYRVLWSACFNASKGKAFGQGAVWKPSYAQLLSGGVGRGSIRRSRRMPGSGSPGCRS